MTRSEVTPHLRLLRHHDLAASGVAPGFDASLHDADMAAQAESDLRVDRSIEARQIAMRALANREHSRGELVDKLERKGIDRDLAHRAVAQLAEEGLQSEDRFVESFVRSRIERGYGPILIRQELRQREVADDAIDEHLTHEQGFWAGRASRALEKRFKVAPDSREDWGRQARYLARRGFSADLIYACLGDQR